MKPFNPCACARTTMVTLLAVVAFCCIVANPRAGIGAGQTTTEARIAPEALTALHLGGLQ